MARLLEKLEEQTARQEQFYQEQSAKLDEQAALCRAQNEKLSMQLEAKLQQHTTTHQDIASKLQAQSSRQENLISELQSRLTEFSTLAVRTQQVEEEQGVAKSRLDTLEGELSGLKQSTSMEYHQLKDMQDQLGLGCEHFRDEIKTQLKELEDKVFQELTARQEISRKELVGEAVRPPHTSAIRPLSPEFSGLFPLPMALDCSSRPAQQQRPPTYDGKTAWDAFKMQFEMLSRINKWTAEEKSTYLAVCLRGPALAVLSNMPADKLYSYDTLVSALEARFGNTHQSELHKMKLRNRIRHKEENIAELAEDIEYLTRLAYPEATAAMQDSLAKDQFIDSLPEEDMRLKIRQSRPKSLREAVELALELEAFQLASRQRVKMVRGAAMESPTQTEVSTDDKMCKQMMQCMQQCMEAMLNHTTERSTGMRGRRTQRGLGGKRELKCWACGQPGHLQRDCPKRLVDSGPSPANSTTAQSGNEN